MNQPLDLEWSYRPNLPEITLEPNAGQRLNVCKSHERLILLTPTLVMYPAVARSVFDSTGVFRFDIKVTADDCKPVDVSVRVSIDGRRWDDPFVELAQGHPDG